jgi:hypothetical protein
MWYVTGQKYGASALSLKRILGLGSYETAWTMRHGNGTFILMTPKKQARKAIKAKIRNLIRCTGAMPIAVLVQRINAALAGWLNYFRVGNASRAFSEVRDYVEMKLRTLLTRRKRRRKTSVGWRRWSNEYLYGVLGLFWDWKLQPLPGAESFA